MVVSVAVKTCTCCKVEKPREAFSKSKGRKDGLRYHCKECERANYEKRVSDPAYAEKLRIYNSEKYLKNLDREKASRKAWASANKEKLRLYQKQYREDNKQALAEAKKAYRLADPERAKQRARSYYLRNKEREDARKRAWDLENPDKRRAHSSKYYEENKLKYIGWAGLRRAAIIKRTPGWLTSEDLSRMENIYLYAKSMSITTGVEYHVDHVLPLRGKFVSGLHVPDNLQVITGKENMSKNNRWVPE